MTQYYVFEIQETTPGVYAHLVHTASDEDRDIARNKGESVYHQVLAAAAVSTLPSHSAIMFSAEGFPVMYQSYKHEVVEEIPEE